MGSSCFHFDSLLRSRKPSQAYNASVGLITYLAGLICMISVVDGGTHYDYSRDLNRKSPSPLSMSFKVAKGGQPDQELLW